MRTRMEMPGMLRMLALLSLLVGSPAMGQPLPAGDTESIPSHPEELVFDELHFDVPEANRYRHVLDNGIVVYVAEDHTFPLVSLRVILRQGSYLEPPDKIGLSGVTGTLIRTGGTKELSPEAFDEQVEFLAADISSFGGDTRAGANLSCITPVLDESLDLFFTMLRNPRFDEQRLEVQKSNLLEAMRQRNDDADDILSRKWGWLLYGEDHYASRRMTLRHLNNISREDLVAFHEKYWRPENMILAISGDIDTETVLAKLEGYTQDWPGRGADNRWPPPLPAHSPRPGVYHAEKDIPQGKVRIGHRVPQWTDWEDPERAAIQVMEHILGGGGFTSRLVQRIRSDEGLAYGAGARFDFDPFQPGTFTISFQSKNPTVALASKIALEEMRRIRDEPVSAEELAIAKSSLIESFPRRFESAQQIVGIYSTDAYLGRSHDYWQKWREQVRAVTAGDVQRVAQKYLKPDEVVFLVVGKWEEIAPGDTGGRASMSELFEGEVTHLPLRDPLTLE